jgi:hypothetical protein
MLTVKNTLLDVNLALEFPDEQKPRLPYQLLPLPSVEISKSRDLVQTYLQLQSKFQTQFSKQIEDINSLQGDDMMND